MRAGLPGEVLNQSWTNYLMGDLRYLETRRREGD